MQRCEALVIGGGMFGCHIACLLRARFASVVVCEAAPELLTRASYANQARVHNGYHYPRSLLTALRSHVNFSRFVDEFRACIDDSFTMYYAIARRDSKVTARQFERFIGAIGSPLAIAPPAVRAQFAEEHIEAVFATVEHAFDAVKLRAEMSARLEHAGVEVNLGCEIERIAASTGGFAVHAGDRQWRADQVFNCTYSNINHVLGRAGSEAIPLRHELTEMCLVEMPPALRDMGVTVMCGPFFSAMPFPPRGLHTLSHVRYTPHGAWQERSLPDGGLHQVADYQLRSRFVEMQRDAMRYLPQLAQCRHVDSLWEIKTVLPQNETDDGRPILWRRDATWPNLVTVMGGKIDNIYDVEREVAAMTELAPGQRDPMTTAPLEVPL